LNCRDKRCVERFDRIIVSVASSFTRFRRSVFPERTILLSLLAIGGSVWAFVAIANAVLQGESRGFDERILRSLRQSGNLAQPIGPEWLSDVARDITALGGVPVILLVAGAVLGHLWLARRSHAAALVLASVTGGAVVMSLLKHVFARERPALVPHLVKVSSLSFPSGHSVLSAVTYLSLGALLARTTRDRVTKIYYLAVATFLAGLIGLSRVYLGVHYPTDVLAGWCVGIAWALLCSTIARWLQRTGAVEPPSAPLPATCEVPVEPPDET
jgi:undecaprenyl-diphosphatase